MNLHLRIGLLLAFLLALPAQQAQAWCVCFPPLPHIHVDCGCKCHLHVTCGPQAPLAPWYLYFPYDVHAQLPPVAPFPNWHGPTAAVPFAAAPVAPTYGAWQLPPAQPAFQAPQLQPAGYVYPQGQNYQPMGYVYPQVPSYWYDRR